MIWGTSAARIRQLVDAGRLHPVGPCGPRRPARFSPAEVYGRLRQRQAEAKE